MVDLTKMYEGGFGLPKPGLTHSAVTAPVHTALAAPKQSSTVTTGPNGSPLRPPAIPGHDRVIKGTANPSIGVGGSPNRPPAIPGHDKPKPKPVAVKPKPKPKPKPAPQPKPKPSGKPPAKPAPKPVSAKPVTQTSSPAPNATVSQGGGGFDLGSLLPIILIAGAVLAGIYLYSHRKG